MILAVKYLESDFQYSTYFPRTKMLETPTNELSYLTNNVFSLMTQHNKNNVQHIFMRSKYVHLKFFIIRYFN